MHLLFNGCCNQNRMHFFFFLFILSLFQMLQQWCKVNANNWICVYVFFFQTKQDFTLQQQKKKFKQTKSRSILEKKKNLLFFNIKKKLRKKQENVVVLQTIDPKCKFDLIKRAKRLLSWVYGHGSVSEALPICVTKH